MQHRCSTCGFFIEGTYYTCTGTLQLVNSLEMIPHVFKLAFAELHGEMDHECSGNGKVEQSEHSVQPQHQRTEREGGERVRERGWYV